MKRFLAVLMTVALACVAGSAWAQPQGASIDGTVTDPSGAVVAGASVEARGATGLAVSAVSGETGQYRFPSLSPGIYEVTARAPGFSVARVEDIHLALGQILQVDVALATAGIAESVTVGGEAPRLDVKQSARLDAA